MRLAETDAPGLHDEFLKRLKNGNATKQEASDYFASVSAQLDDTVLNAITAYCNTALLPVTEKSLREHEEVIHIQARNFINAAYGEDHELAAMCLTSARMAITTAEALSTKVRVEDAHARARGWLGLARTIVPGLAEILYPDIIERIDTFMFRQPEVEID